VVVQLPKLQQVVHVTYRPFEKMVWVEHAAQTAVADTASAIAMIAFFMMLPWVD
jgi:hypothetical protein